MSAAPTNLAQQRAVTTTDGPLLIIAGPGSGKTHTLVERVVYLITEKGVTSDSLFVATFSEKVAGELTTRITNRLSALGIEVNLTDMYVGTLHSLGLRILDEHRERTRLKRNYAVWDQFDQRYAIYRSLKIFYEVEGAEQLLGPQRSGSQWEKAATLAGRFNQVSEELLAPVDLRNSSEPAVSALGRLYERYELLLQEQNALDFSMIQVDVVSLLRHHPSVLDALRARLRYLMIDEYQDTNTVQEEFITLLAGDCRNICVVGDDDQALYRFRGATVRNILEFPERFPGCAQEKLVDNYRSQPGIVGFFDPWMAAHDWAVNQRAMRFPKSIRAARPAASPPPHVVKVTGAPGAWEKEVLAFLRALEASGRLANWNQVAFLFRSVRNRDVLTLARLLENEGIPIYSPRSNLFFEREEVRLTVGALCLLFPQFDAVVRNVWKGVRPDVFVWYEGCATGFLDATEGRPEHTELRRWMGYRRKAHETLTEETDYAFSGLFYELLSFAPFARWLDDPIAHGGVRESRAARNLAMLSRIITRFEAWHGIAVLSPKYLDSNLRSFFSSYFRFLFDGGIDEFEDEADYAPSGCVALMTIHQAKGLQFPITIVGLPPSGPRKQYDELDEILQRDHYSKPALEPLERQKDYDFWRLYYTAFSRAQDLLVLTAPEKLAGKGRKSPCAEFHDICRETPSWRTAPMLLQELALSPVQKTELKAEYSFTSHVTVFENCPRQYQFFKDLDFNPVRSNAILFGTLVHQTIEDIHKAVLRDEAATISPDRVESWFLENYRHLSKRERRYLSQQALASALGHVTRYVEHRAGNWKDVIAAEVDVSLVRDHYILEGTIDLLQGEGDTVEVVDFKSETKPEMEKEASHPARNSSARTATCDTTATAEDKP